MNDLTELMFVMFFQTMPRLPVACDDTDGDVNNLPIIFEDVYRDGLQDSSSFNLIHFTKLSLTKYVTGPPG